MSKAIAQPASGKRFAWLLALVAVFALLAGAQLSVKSADAASTGAGFLPQADTTTGDPLPQLPVLEPGLYHVSPDGETLLGIRDEERNLIGWQHTVCLVPSDDNDEMADDLAVSGPGGILPINNPNANYSWRIEATSGTPTVTGAAKVTGQFGGAGAGFLG